MNKLKKVHRDQKIKYILISVILLLLIGQKTVGQSIIMGSSALVDSIDDQPRFFYDPGGGGDPVEMGVNQDPHGYFAQDLRDTMTLQTDLTNARLYIWFEEFAVGPGDTLWVFDGDASNIDNDYLLGFYSLKNSPGEVVSSGQSLTLVFHSDNVNASGFMEGWTAIVFADPLREIFFGTVTDVSTCNAVFYDSGGQNDNIAGDNENLDSIQYVNFASPAGTHIKCEFTQFDVNGVLQIYDGLFNDTNKRLIGQFCTSTLGLYTNIMPPVLFSVSDALCFVYIGAGGDVNKAGWRAEISCVSELLEIHEGLIAPSITNVPCGFYSTVPNPEVIVLDSLHPTVVIEAGIVALGQYTNDYTVKQIPFGSHIFDFNQGTSIGAHSDDLWQPGIQLPFTFSFFGKPYTTVFPGGNGLISMTPQYNYCSYAYAPPPTTPPYFSVPYLYPNCIYGVFEDVDCRYFTDKNDGLGMGDVRAGVFGVPPCRAFVLNFLNVGLYGLTNNTNTGDQYDNYNTYQMVIYEGTNIIDVYVKHRKCCATTNQQGEGIIGLQNTTSSQILLAPGRGMTGWDADDEAWRFIPITPMDEHAELTWYQDVVDENHIISRNTQAKNRYIAVSPTESTKYISVYEFTDASGNHFILRDTTHVLCLEPGSTGVAESNTNFEVYPNPTHDVVYVKISNPEILPEHLVVMDLQGRPLFVLPAEEITLVDFSRLPAGIYLLRANDKGVGVAKIIKK